MPLSDPPPTTTLTERDAALLVLECVGAHFTGNQSQEIADRVVAAAVIVAASAIGQLAALIEQCSDAEGIQREDVLRDLYAAAQLLDDFDTSEVA